MAGRTTQDKDSLQPLEDQFREIWRQIRTLQQPTGTSLVGLVEQVQQTLAAIEANLASMVTAYLSSGFTTGSMTATGNVNVGGTMTATTGITSPGAAALDVSTIPGSRQPSWQHIASGRYGYAPSTVVKKINVDGYGGKASQFLACMPIVWEYLSQIDIRDNPENPYYDPEYVVPVEVGLLAELLIANGLPEFVFFHDGEPAGIYMAEFAAVGFVIVGRDHEARLRQLEALLP